MNALTISGRRILAVGALAATVVAFGPTAQAVSGRPGTAVPAVRDSVHTPSANQSVRTLAGGGLAAATIGNAPNCVLSGTTRTCSVYGKTGSWTAGGVTFPVWGFSPSSAAAATIPGPTLTATVGENLVMRLYNRLPGAVGPLGLEVPGLTGFQSDVTGIAASTTPKNYQAVTLTTPGTYVYQASPTSNGAREVAMGMSGVLIVRPAGYDANDPTKRTAYGNPTGVPTAPDAFDSESLVVLNEFDLSFSAGSVSAVNNRDVTNYRPKVFLINGQAFNSAQPAARTRSRWRPATISCCGTPTSACGNAPWGYWVCGRTCRPAVALAAVRAQPERCHDRPAGCGPDAQHAERLPESGRDDGHVVARRRGRDGRSVATRSWTPVCTSTTTPPPVSAA